MTAWKIYNGIGVEVDDNGDFCAAVNGMFIRDAVWERLRLRLEQEKKTEAGAMKLELDCVVLVGDGDTGEFEVRQLKLVGVNRADSSFKWSQKVDKGKIVYVLPSTQANANLLEELAIAKSATCRIGADIKELIIAETKWGGRIEASKYAEQLQNLKDRYLRALERSAT